jgi:uncharacterized phage infection (PIP) family protein YhgE
MMVFCAIIAFFMIAFGLLASVIIPIFLLTMYTTSTGIFPHELDNGFFYLGYALPFYHSVSASRFIMFGSHNQIGLNVGILLAWLIIAIILNHIGNTLTIAQVLRQKAPEAVKDALKANNVIGTQVESSDTASAPHIDNNSKQDFPHDEELHEQEHHDEIDIKET